MKKNTQSANSLIMDITVLELQTKELNSLSNILFNMQINSVSQSDLDHIDNELREGNVNDLSDFNSLLYDLIWKKTNEAETLRKRLVRVDKRDNKLELC